VKGYRTGAEEMLGRLLNREKPNIGIDEENERHIAAAQKTKRRNGETEKRPLCQ